MQNATFDSTQKHPLFATLIERANLFGKNTIIIEDAMGNSFTYGKLIKAALALGRLSTRFTQEKENVGVLLPNIAPTVGLIYGLLAYNRVPAMLNYSTGISGILHACKVAKIKVIVTSKTFLEKTNLDDLTTVEKDVELLYLEDLKAGFGIFDKLWLIFYALWFPEAATGETKNINSPAFTLFTSGSEGNPKGVVLSHYNITSNAHQCSALIDLSNKDVFLSALPIFHAMGLTAGIFLPIYTGSRIQLYISPLHYRIIPEIVYAKNCTVIFGSSTFLRYYAHFADPYDFHSLRLAIAGAEKLAKDVYELWQEKFGIRIFEGYGATECSPVISVNTPMDNMPGTVGRTVPGIEYKLKKVEDIEEGGLLHVKGPNVMLGYYKNTNPGVIEKVTSDFGSGWYSTGDIVTVSDLDFITIAGRLKRFAKVAGEMVSLESVEAIALHASSNYVHAAITAFDQERGESIILCTTDSKLNRKHLREAAHFMGRGELEVARKIVYLEEIPRLGTGKIDYFTLKKQFSQEK